METVELLKKIRRIEIRSKKLTKEIFAGEYRSAFKGRGMAFSEVREYAPGDEVRDIDWNVTARYGRPFVKVYEEERELTVLLLVDVSSSGLFGTRVRTKRQLLAEIAGTLAFSTISNNDKVGVLFFSDRVEKYIPPGKGRKHILHILREILSIEPQGTSTDISSALIYANNVHKRHCTMFVLSDFIDERDYSKAISVVSRKHNVMAIQVFDPREAELPKVGLIRVQDAETGRIEMIDSSSEKVRTAYQEHWQQLNRFMESTFAKYSIDYASTSTDKDYVPVLLQLFDNHR